MYWIESSPLRVSKENAGRAHREHNLFYAPIQEIGRVSFWRFSCTKETNTIIERGFCQKDVGADFLEYRQRIVTNIPQARMIIPIKAEQSATRTCLRN